jgi:beta-glucosidase
MDRKTAIVKAKALVAQMTVEEAASQLTYGSPAIKDEERGLDIPAYNWWNEALHGVARGGTATMFPQAIGMAAMFDADRMKTVGGIIATEGRAKYNEMSAHGDRDIYKGLTFWSPNINIFRDPRWGRGHETYGEDPFLTAELGKAFVKGIQGEDESGFLKAAACAKHFAAHSGPENLRHVFNAEVTDKDLFETYLPAFEALVKDAKVEAVMGAYNRTNGEPCCGSKRLITDILREKWGFEGHYVSDCWAIQDFHNNHKVTASPAESAALAISTGCDLNCGVTYVYLYIAYQQGLITEAQIRQSAERIFTTRYMLGIMNDGEHNAEYDNIPYEVVECDKHIGEAIDAAAKSCVLLKNDGILPLAAEKINTIAVIGPNANNRTALIGNYYGTSSRYITVLEGIQDRATKDHIRVLYSEGSPLKGGSVEGLAFEGDRIAEAVTAAEHADVAVLVVGLDETLEGEEGDRGNQSASGDKLDLLLPACQRKLIDAVLAVGKPTVICLMAGSAIDLQDANTGANAILHTWYPGARGGKAVADILFGGVSPSGKLPVTFYHNSDLADFPAFTDYGMAGRTYRYLRSEPLYPFGFGITYGDVTVTGAEIHKNGEDFTVAATAVNHSSTATDEVIQVYCQNEGSAFAPDHPRLVGFARAFFPAEAAQTVRIRLSAESLMVVNNAGERIEDGDLVFYVGTGQPDERTKTLTGKTAVRVRVE